ncbi:phosphatidic acid phosphatase type 2/haloperoxidase [Fimicolochytrium jonesii]|uniref:phosphatidic acid phosphatase type 2/haloperoxidase n=1 Tax=Fimicolochytrium jonesii TaxID=1396493 RepID=UPI0022FE9BF0|nr:phosphatidic acid phosphatase type 2/haloperoxidase [Fimicolochytrium jonesii]KAI8817390.1 phosphatidic acid phosphatase type 2/haloperoxidase [Fimicolochytrium jonesii]
MPALSWRQKWAEKGGFVADPQGWSLPSKLDIPTKSRRSYVLARILDWVLIIVCLILTQVFYAYVTKPEIYFNVNDQFYMAPVLPDRVSSFLSTVVSVAIPIALIVILNLVFYTSWPDMYHAVTGLVQALAMTMVTCSFLWATIGGLRPYHITKCDPDPAKLVAGQLYYTESVCRTKLEKVDLNGFPSGHAGSAFTCWVFLSFWMHAKLKPYNGTAQFYKLLVTFIPLIVAGYISLTRIMDFHHTTGQVLTGMAIGITAAVFAYKLNYPMHGWFYGERHGNGDIPAYVLPRYTPARSGRQTMPDGTVAPRDYSAEEGSRANLQNEMSGTAIQVD